LLALPAYVTWSHLQRSLDPFNAMTMLFHHCKRG
jgi:hypothetical protein